MAAPGDALASVAQLLEAGRYDAVAEALDQAELEEPSALSSEQWPHALHLLAHVYAGRLEDARFVWKRSPDAAKAGSPELQAAFALLQRLWMKDYQQMWGALQFAWGPQTQPLVAALAERLRGRQLDLVGRAYASISPAALAALLGCSEGDAVAAAAARGWPVVDGLVEPAPAPAAAAAEAAVQHSLQRLAEYVVHLEA